VDPRPIAPETWGKLPPEVQGYILASKNALRQSLNRIVQLEQKVNELEAGLIAVPAISLSPISRPSSGSEKPQEKRLRHPGAYLDIRETIGNWHRLRNWIRSWSIGRKPVLTVGVCWLRARKDNFLPWNDINTGTARNSAYYYRTPTGGRLVSPLTGLGKGRVAGRGGRTVAGALWRERQPGKHSESVRRNLRGHGGLLPGSQRCGGPCRHSESG